MMKRAMMFPWYFQQNETMVLDFQGTLSALGLNFFVIAPVVSAARAPAKLLPF